jgi:hypothetical protein
MKSFVAIDFETENQHNALADVEASTFIATKIL